MIYAGIHLLAFVGLYSAICERLPGTQNLTERCVLTIVVAAFLIANLARHKEDA